MARGATVTGLQVRMARTALRWSIAELARRADVGISTVQAIEAAAEGEPTVSAEGLEATAEYRGSARTASLDAIRKALTASGVTFLPDDGKHGPGIRFRARAAG
jgi:transcriptional regulator with XRE-family HTH domain